MSPEKLAELQLLRNTIQSASSTEEEKKEATRQFVAMTREARGVIVTAVEKKVVRSRAKKVDTEALLNDFLGAQS